MKNVSPLNVLTGLALVIVLVIGLAWVYSPPAVERAGENTKIYFTDGGDKLVLASGATLEAQSGSTVSTAGTLSMPGTLTASGTLNVTGSLTVPGEVIYTATAVTVTNGSTLTPAATYYNLDSATAVTVTLGTSGAVAGQILYLYGADANTITIADTNIRTSDGNAATLGQYDLIAWLFNGTDWVQLVKTANQ